MSISTNACGRFTNDLQKSDLDNRIARDKRLRVQNRAELTIPPGGLVDSVCTSFYASKDVGQITNDCRTCIERTSENDIDCSCSWNKNFCKYAECVADEYRKNKRCVHSFQAVFNSDDFKDDKYRAEINPSQLKHCEIFSDEHYNALPDVATSLADNETTITNSSSSQYSGIWTIGIILLFIFGSFFALKLFKWIQEKKKSKSTMLII
jgi:hypothetical protein